MSYFCLSSVPNTIPYFVPQKWKKRKKRCPLPKISQIYNNDVKSKKKKKNTVSEIAELNDKLYILHTLGSN